MKLKSLIPLMVLIFTSTTLFADQVAITLTNNTKTYATAFIGKVGCTADYGDWGIIGPNGDSRTIPQFIVDRFCGNSCESAIYMTKNCSGPKIATARIEKKNGIVAITNHNVDGYVVSGGGKSAQVNGGPQYRWFDYFETLN